MSEPTSESVAVVGTGAVGTALAHALIHAGVRVQAVAGRDPARARKLADACGASQSLTIEEAGCVAPVVIVAVSDGAIEEVGATLRVRTGTVVAHTSGSRPAEALAAVRAGGGIPGGFHPLSALVAAERLREPPTKAEWSEWFAGAAFAIEGPDLVVERLSALARRLGGHPFAISAADKPVYHLGASMLAAFSAGLSQLSWDAMRVAQAPPEVASRGAGHLLRTVALNVIRARTPAEILTGPVARGDAHGVARQAKAAEALTPEAQALYRVHVAHNIELALKAGRISEATAHALRASTTSNAHGTAQRS